MLYHTSFSVSPWVASKLGVEMWLPARKMPLDFWPFFTCQLNTVPYIDSKQMFRINRINLNLIALTFMALSSKTWQKLGLRSLWRYLKAMPKIYIARAVLRFYDLLYEPFNIRNDKARLWHWFLSQSLSQGNYSSRQEDTIQSVQYVDCRFLTF